METQITEQPNDAVEAPEGDANEQIPGAPVDITELSQNLSEAREQVEAATTRGDQFYQALHLATMQQATGDILHATSDMPDDDERYRDDSGFPSVEGMRAVAEELISHKPYLAKVRGNVEQGAKQQTPQASWSDVMRSVLG